MRFIVIIIVVLYSMFGFSANPVIEGIGMSDPHIRVFNDTIFLFSGHDDSPSDKLWIMKDWRVFSSTDLINWNHETTILPANNYMGGSSTDCWAGDAAERNGSYFFYFSDQKRSIGVMKSGSPGGTYTDAIGKPLVAPMHDPTLFVDDDKAKTPYLVYGDKEGGGYHIARLRNSMIDLDEEPRPININGEAWDIAPKWMDKNYLFKSNGVYYLSWGRDYATSENIYGPYECVGSFGSGHHLNEFAHGSFFWWKGQFYHIWTYYIKPGFKYRNCLISYCHIDENGRVSTDTKFLDKHLSIGVGQYDATWDKIEAEWYSEVPNGIVKRKTSDDGVELSNIKNGAWVRFANMNFSKSFNRLNAFVSCSNKGGLIEFRADSLSGPILGSVLVPKFNSSKQSLTLSGAISPTRGIRDVYLRFVGSSDAEISLDYFFFD